LLTVGLNSFIFMAKYGAQLRQQKKINIQADLFHILLCTFPSARYSRDLRYVSMTSSMGFFQVPFLADFYCSYLKLKEFRQTSAPNPLHI
jgi:hypothetical protein